MKPMNRPTRRREAGFTTIELSMTLVLAGLVLAAGLHRVDSSSWKLDTAGQQIVQRARAARALAVLKSHDVILSFDLEARRVQVHEDANNDGVVNEGERVFGETLEGKARFTRAGAPPFGDFDDGAIGFTDNKVTFMRNGSASEEGAVYVSRSGMDKARVVVINRATGYAEMHRYNGDGWISE